MNHRANIFRVTPRSWLGWVGVVTVGIALLLVAALFLTVALVIGAVIATGLVARAYWLIRKAERQRADTYLTAEYKVEPGKTTSAEGEVSRREQRHG